MNQRMPCGLDDERIRFEPDEPDDDPRSHVEKRLEWICEQWADALIDDTYETWRDVRMMIYGATQALIHCRDRHQDIEELGHLSSMAFENSISCIQKGKYDDDSANRS